MYRLTCMTEKPKSRCQEIKEAGKLKTFASKEHDPGGGERAQEVCPSTHVTDCVCYYGRDEVRGWCSKNSKPRADPSVPQAPFPDTCPVSASVSGFLETASGWGSWRSVPLGFGSSRVPPTRRAGAMGGHLIH